MKDEEAVHMAFQPDAPCLNLTIATKNNGTFLSYTAGEGLRNALREKTMLADGRTMGQALEDHMRERLQEFIEHNRGH